MLYKFGYVFFCFLCLYVMHISTRVLRQSNIIIIMENAPGNASSEKVKYLSSFPSF